MLFFSREPQPFHLLPTLYNCFSLYLDFKLSVWFVKMSDGSQSGYAEALNSCPHSKHHIKEDLRSKDLPQGDSKVACSVDGCDVDKENWLCLTCLLPFCGRFAQQHMVAHFESTGHCIASGLADLSFWCYECDSYINHQTIEPVWKVYYALHCQKFGEAPPFQPSFGFDRRSEAGGAEGGAESKADAAPSVHTPSDQAAQALPNAELNVNDQPSDEVDMDAVPPEAGQADSGGQAGQLEAGGRVPPSEDHPEASAGNAEAQQEAKQEGKQEGKQEEAQEEAHGGLEIEGLSAEQLADPVIDKILGTIYGNALGDAVGLSTEFLAKSDVLRLYGDGPIPFPDFVPNRHNRRWTKGDWTDDTDQMILIMQTIISKGKADERDFGRRLVRWIDHGFKELGDLGGMGLGMTVGRVCKDANFTKDPHSVSRRVWEASGKQLAANGAVMRTAILGCFQHNQLQQVVANSEKIARVTHFDERCVASCVFVAVAIALLVQGRPADTQQQVEAIIQEANAWCGPILASEQEDGKEGGRYRDEFARHVSAADLAALRLADDSGIGYTLKCLGCGVYGLRSSKDFKGTIDDVAKEAGDADTNGAVCGAVMGAKIGYSRLPRDWLQALPHKTWLDKQVVAFLRVAGLIPAAKDPSLLNRLKNWIK